MSYWLESDTFHEDPRWAVLSGGKRARRLELQASFACLMSLASHLRDDGYLQAEAVLRQCGRKAVVDALCTPVLDRAPLLHSKGDECPCLGDGWIDGFDFRIHNFLKRNPARKETDRNKAQAADRKDVRLRKLVYDRDGGCCRYCRSGPIDTQVRRANDRRRLLSLDHVDPDQPATPDGGNFVTACARCNTDDKGHMTPHEAGMVLLPEPTPEQIAEWKARGNQLFDRPAAGVDELPNQATDQAGTSAEPDQNQAPDLDPDLGPNLGPDPGLIPGSEPDHTGDLRPDQEQPSTRPAAESAQGYRGSGRAAAPDVVRTPPPPNARADPHGQPPRSSAAPDIYTGRSRSPDNPRDSP